MNFEAVGPDRLVLVARDPWIAAPCVIGARVCHSIFFALKRFRVLPKPANGGCPSITSSARPSSVSGKVTPSALAALRLMTSSTFVTLIPLF